MRSRFARMSLRWRLSWLLAMGTIVTVTLYGFVAYRAAMASAIEGANAQLRSATIQIITITELGALSQVEILKTAAGSPAVIEALSQPGRPLSEAAAAALLPLQGASPNTVVVELLGRDRTAIHTIPPGSPPPPEFEGFDPPPEGAIGPLFLHDGAMFFLSGISVPAAGGEIRVTRRLAAGSANRRIAANLLGQDVTLLIGNLDGNLWSDATPVQYPGASHVATRYERDGRTWRSFAANVKGTPWLYAVEIPEHVAVAPARALLPALILTGTLIALVGAFIGLRVSRRITTPLADLTAATEAIARGDRSVSMKATDGEDEIGRLSRSFAVMATSIRAVQDRLESEVDTRTGELTTAVDRLRRLDEELRQSERFATLGRLSGNVSHELRNPLGVMSTVVFLLDDLPDASPRIKQYAKLLREQIRLSERIITDLLDRARSDAPVHSAVDVARLLDDLIVRANIPSTLRIERRYKSPLPPVLIDRDQVGQIVWNLLTNAVQSMQSAPGKSHTLTVEASIVSGHLRIEVSDSGPGVPAEAADRIFEAMFTTKPQGVGLGLSISRAFARASGGDLILAKSDETGARFVLDLPVTLASATAGDTASTRVSAIGD